MSQNQEARARFFRELAEIRLKADAAFAKVRELHPREVACRLGCDDCCHALFDLAPAEALALALAFASLPRDQRREAGRRAEKAARQFDAVMALALSLSGEERLAELSRARVACPLLVKNACLLHSERPVTCRLYGVPLAIEGKSRICPRAGFRKGVVYPSVDVGALHALLEGLSPLARSLVPELPPARLDLARILAWAESERLTLTSLMT